MFFKHTHQTNPVRDTKELHRVTQRWHRVTHNSSRRTGSRLRSKPAVQRPEIVGQALGLVQMQRGRTSPRPTGAKHKLLKKTLS